MKEFFTTLQGKVITALTIIALILGIAAEGVSMYRNAMEGETAAETAHNAAKLRVAEAEERTQLAKKAAFEAEMAKAAADNAAKLKLAEAEERTQLAKKAAADAETALATAKYADTQKAADAELTRQKDRSETANADINEVIANTIAGGPGWHRDATALTAPKAFGGGSPAPATTTEPDQPTRKL